MLLIDGVKYRPWTPKDEEKEFKITSRDQIDYAMELIKRSYALAE